MKVSKNLIIKSLILDFRFCLVIKGLDNQDQKTNNQINQYPQKSLIVTLDSMGYRYFTLQFFSVCLRVL